MRASWGGRRHGAGRKPKATILAHPSAPASRPAGPAEWIDPPAELAPEEVAIWMRQAPHALAAGTLTAASAAAFARYCRVSLLERLEAEGGAAGAANHRGLLKLIQAFEVHYGLIPAAGRPMANAAPAAAAPVVDPNDAYFGDVERRA